MTPTAALGPQDLCAALTTYRDLLRDHQSAINRLNVYPVPDGDTGTNMALTLEAVVREIDALDDATEMADVCRAMSHGSLMGARGNSGVILSQLLRGIAERFTGADEVGPFVIADALVLASDLAHKAVVRPVEGTILTVARAAGEGASAGSAAGDQLVGVVERARSAAADALADTPKMLDVLARAGVVDAGGTGYVLLLDALLSTIDGRALPEPDAGEPDALTLLGGIGVGSHGSGDGAGVDALRYEVMYLLDAPDDTIVAFKEVWAGIGDSIVVVGGDGLWNCHIHTDDIGAAVEAALDAGRPRRIRVTDLAEQVQEERWVREASAGAGQGGLGEAEAAPTTAVVAVVIGEGVGRIFRSLGVQRLVQGGQSMNPSTADLLEAVESLGSAEVVILPNNPNIRPVAEQVDALTDKMVQVVPSGSIVEGFAALLSYDPDARAEENTAAMTASAARVVPGAVTRAVRDADTDAGTVNEGDWIGVTHNHVLAVAGSAAEAALRLLESLVQPTHELVTVIEGEGATPADTRRITEWLDESYPEMATEVHHGGQPLYPYLFGIE